MSAASTQFGPFRPLVPFGEADRALFYGREQPVQELSVLILQSRDVLFYGAPGVGKTSLMRAGVLPALKLRGVGCRYLAVGDGQELLAPNFQFPNRAQQGALLVLDDLGPSLIDDTRFARLVDLIKRARSLAGLRVLYVMDEGDLYRFDRLHDALSVIDAVEIEAGTPLPTALPDASTESSGLVRVLIEPPTRYRLTPLAESRIAEILERTVLSGGAYFEAGLAKEMAQDLSRKGPVSPTDMQVVAGAAVLFKITTIGGFRKAGGAEPLKWRFLQWACRSTSGRTAERVLGEVAGLQPHEWVSGEELGRVAGVDVPTAQRGASLLVEQHLLRPLGTAFGLQTEWLRPLIRAFTGEQRARSVQARLKLQRKMEAGKLLSLHEVRELRRYASSLRPEERRAVDRSRRVVFSLLAVAIALPLGWLASSYLWNSSHVTFDFDQSGPGAGVVVRLGKQGSVLSLLPHHPAFGSIVGETGFMRSALASDLPASTAPRGAWLSPLMSALSPLPQALTALLTEGKVTALTAMYEDPAARSLVLDALMVAGRGAPEELTLIDRAIKDPSEDLRRRALLALCTIERRKPGVAKARLAQLLKDPSPQVRAFFGKELRNLPESVQTELWTRALGSDDLELRKEGLAQLEKAAVAHPALWSEVATGLSGPLRADVAAQLGGALESKDAETVTVVEGALRGIVLDAKAVEDARVEALRLLRQKGAKGLEVDTLQGSPRLLAMALPLSLSENPDQADAKIAEAMKGPTPMRVAAAAAIALVPKSDNTAKWLKVLSYDNSPEVRAEAVRSLPVLGRDSLGAIMKEVREGGADVERAAIDALEHNASKFGVAQVVSLLENAVKGTRQTTRHAAISAIGRIGAAGKSNAAFSALSRLLHDKVVDIRAAAAEALGSLAASNTTEVANILRGAAKDPDPAVRRRAAEALGRAADSNGDDGQKGQAATKALLAFAGDSDSMVRAEVASALERTKLSGGQVSSAIVALIADKDPAVRAAARRAAAKVGTAGAEMDQTLESLFAHASKEDKLDLASLAGKVSAAKTLALALRDPDPAVRRAAAENAGSLGGAMVAQLESALGDEDPKTRAAALKGLVGVKAVASLKAALRKADPEQRGQILEALGEVGSADATSVLKNALVDSSERVRVGAVRGLGHATGGAQYVTAALADPARDVRDAAVSALARLWSTQPVGELRDAIGDERHADRRYAAAIALAQKLSQKDASDARKLLDETVKSGPVGCAFAAKIALAFAGRADQMDHFVHLVRNGQ